MLSPVRLLPVIAISPIDLSPAASGQWRIAGRLDGLASVLQRKSIAVAAQHDLALVEGLKRGAMSDRNDGACRKFLFKQLVKHLLRGFIERGCGFVEKEILRLMQ